jgi:hypothetical protein
MVRHPGEARKGISHADLIAAAERLRARRNDSLFFACGAAALIDLQSWHRLFFLLPAVLALYAAIAQVNLRLMEAELKRRISEGEQHAAGECEDARSEGTQSRCAHRRPSDVGHLHVQTGGCCDPSTIVDGESGPRDLDRIGPGAGFVAEDRPAASSNVVRTMNEHELRDWVNARIAKYGSRPSTTTLRKLKKT